MHKNFWLCLFVAAFPALGNAAQTETSAPWRDEIERSRSLYWLARHQSDEEQRLRLFEEGRDLALHVWQAKPDAPEAILWWAANEGAVAEQKRNLSSLGALKRIEKALLELHALDAGYGYAAAARGLGNVYRRAPGFISIGSNRKAEKFLREAASAAPDFPGNLLGLADFLLEDGQTDEARKLALQVVGMEKWKSGQFGEFEPERPEWTRLLDKILAETGKTKS